MSDKFEGDLRERAQQIVLEGIHNSLAKFFDGQVTADETVAGGFALAGPPNENGSVTTAAVAWTFHGTHARKFLAVEPAGQAIDIVGMTVLRIENDQTLVSRNYIDWHHVLAQLGSIPSRAVSPVSTG